MGVDGEFVQDKYKQSTNKSLYLITVNVLEIILKITLVSYLSL